MTSGSASAGWSMTRSGTKTANRALLERLPLEPVGVIMLAFFQGMSHSEMAEYLDPPLGTVKTCVRLGLQRLKAVPREFIDG